MKPPDPELRKLVDRLLDEGALTKPDMARLEEFLENDDALSWYLAAAEQESALPDLLRDLPAGMPAPGKVRRFPFAPVALSAAAAIALFAGGFWVGRSKTPEPQASMPPSSDTPARITGLVGVEWNSGQAPDLVTNNGAVKRLSFRTGIAELTYGNGVRVTLEGPSDFQITGPNSARLDSGRLVAAVPRGAEGFQIDYAGGKVVDLGTEFGLDTSPGGATELGVFDGKVELHRPGSDILSLMQNQAVLLDPGSEDPVSAIPLNRSKFVRRIPARDFRWEITAKGPRTVEFDVSHLVWKSSNYRALFKWMQGPDAVSVRDVTLCLNGQPVTTAGNTGSTGDLIWVHDNLFELPVGADRFKRGRWTIRAVIETVPRAPALEKANPPVHSLGILQFEEGLVSKATASDFIGAWAYSYGGHSFERHVEPDGTLRLFKNGKPDPTSFVDSRWSVVDGVLRVNIPEFNAVEEHVLRDANTMIFVSRPYDNARKISPE